MKSHVVEFDGIKLDIRKIARDIGESYKEAAEALHYSVCHSPDKETPLNMPAVCHDPDCKYRLQ